jgi:hypothetical protein
MGHGTSFSIGAIICFVLTGHLFIVRDHPGDANSGVTVTPVTLSATDKARVLTIR